ncbi:MAG: imelysin family protein [Bacteroidota bacterium]
MRNIKLVFSAALTFFLFSTSCKEKKPEPDVTFEKKDITANLADNWIIPGYQQLDERIGTLQGKWEAFEAAPDAAALTELREAWKSAYLGFEQVKMFDFGPAMNIGLAGALGSFPSDTAAIEDNISSGSYNLLTAANVTAIGFPALDYLFFRQDALADLQAANRKAYVSDVIAKMKGEVASVVSGWGTYRSTFVEGTGTTSTSPFSLLINGYCKDFELAKHTKVGIPLGKQSLGILRPEFLEARYSKFGKELLVENLKALRGIFLGNKLSGGAAGIGFDDYLTALDKQTLAQTIETRFNYLVSDPSGWTADMEGMITDQTSVIDAYYTYIHGTVVYIKTDMTSAFGILITYQDNDGD